MSDIISIFNRLTDNELADYHLFENILDNHYGKFKYFYYIIRELDITKVNRITCKIVSDSELLFSIKSNKRTVKKYLCTYDDFNRSSNTYFNRYFSYNILEVDSGVEVHIRCNCDDENKIYMDNYSFL